MAVGEMSPENENSTSVLRGGPGGRTSATSPRIRKQDSYLKAIGNNEDELSPLPRRLVQVRHPEFEFTATNGKFDNFFNIDP